MRFDGSLDWLTKRPIAHRGLHDPSNGRPENSLAAFKAAIEHNYIIEMDVRLSADGRVVVFHDDTLGRMTRQTGPVAAASWEQLKTLRLSGSDQHIPLLEDALDLVDGKAPLLVEIKNALRQVGDLERQAWRLLRKYKHTYAVQSFNPYSLRWFRKYAPAVIRGQLSGDFRDIKLALHRKMILKHFGLNYISRPHFINYDINVLPNKIVKRLRRKGKLVLGWTARSPEEYQRALRYCDNIVFEQFCP